MHYAGLYERWFMILDRLKYFILNIEWLFKMAASGLQRIYIDIPSVSVFINTKL